MNFDEVWERVRSRTGWRKYGEMADFLGIRSQSVSSARNKGLFLVEWAFKIAQKYDISTDWLLTGRHPGAGESAHIDEDFFVRVVHVIESLINERKIDQITLWQKVRIYIYVYESCLDSRKIDLEMMKKVISLAVPSALSIDTDSDIIKLVENLAATEASSPMEKVERIDQWWEFLSKEYPGLLVPIRERQRVFQLLEEKAEEIRNRKEPEGG
jgi:hypothetical protein